MQQKIIVKEHDSSRRRQQKPLQNRIHKYTHTMSTHTGEQKRAKKHWVNCIVYMIVSVYANDTLTHMHATAIESEWVEKKCKINWMKKRIRENKMHVIYNRLQLILLPVDGWRHVIFTFACMQTHQTQERSHTNCDHFQLPTRKRRCTHGTYTL